MAEKKDEKEIEAIKYLQNLDDNEESFRSPEQKLDDTQNDKILSPSQVSFANFIIEL